MGYLLLCVLFSTTTTYYGFGCLLPNFCLHNGRNPNDSFIHSIKLHKNGSFGYLYLQLSHFHVLMSMHCNPFEDFETMLTFIRYPKDRKKVCTMIFFPIFHENKYSSNKNKHVTKKSSFEVWKTTKYEGGRKEAWIEIKKRNVMWKGREMWFSLDHIKTLPYWLLLHTTSSNDYKTFDTTFWVDLT